MVGAYFYGGCIGRRFLRIADRAAQRVTRLKRSDKGGRIHNSPSLAE
ncbi:hypothetical protein M2351_001529 [Azospirillum canadense]|nr:hypothetical protein [Azospirillum canadense]